MKKAVITGGIGSGKSVVSTLLQTIGYPVYNSDSESKRLLNEDPDLQQQLSKTFGKDLYKEGLLDKQLFASIIFGNEERLRQANAIIHPAVYRDFDRWAAAQTAEIVFMETALYFQKPTLPPTVQKEDGFYSILVQAPFAVRIRRVMQRDNCTEAAVLSRINSQVSDEEVAHLADFHILNDDEHLLIPQVLQIVLELLEAH
jgi:dephospho-CoA kinase